MGPLSPYRARPPSQPEPKRTYVYAVPPAACQKRSWRWLWWLLATNATAAALVAIWHAPFAVLLAVALTLGWLSGKR